MCNFLDQLLHPYNFYGSDMSEIPFFMFASYESLIMMPSYKAKSVRNTKSIRKRNTL